MPKICFLLMTRTTTLPFQKTLNCLPCLLPVDSNLQLILLFISTCLGMGHSDFLYVITMPILFWLALCHNSLLDIKTKYIYIIPYINNNWQILVFWGFPSKNTFMVYQRNKLDCLYTAIKILNFCVKVILINWLMT